MEEPKTELNVDQLTRARNQVLSTHTFLGKLKAESQPPVVQEIVLAERALEEARMRLGVARAYLAGDDPFKHERIEEVA